MVVAILLSLAVHIILSGAACSLVPRNSSLFLVSPFYSILLHFQLEVSLTKILKYKDVRIFVYDIAHIIRVEVKNRI